MKNRTSCQYDYRSGRAKIRTERVCWKRLKRIRMYEEIFRKMKKKYKSFNFFELVDGSMVIEKDITFFSMCEHHFFYLFGKVHIAYLPDGRVAGLSKLARCVDVYAKKTATSERLNMEIADAIMEFFKRKRCVGCY